MRDPTNPPTLNKALIKSPIRFKKIVIRCLSQDWMSYKVIEIQF